MRDINRNDIISKLIKYKYETNRGKIAYSKIINLIINYSKSEKRHLVLKM